MGNGNNKPNLSISKLMGKKMASIFQAVALAIYLLKNVLVGDIRYCKLGQMDMWSLKIN